MRVRVLALSTLVLVGLLGQPDATAAPPSTSAPVVAAPTRPGDDSGDELARRLLGPVTGDVAAAGTPVSFTGGDLVAVSPAVSLGESTRTATWATVPVGGRAGVPTGGAQAVVLAVHALSSTAAGQVLVRPLGGTATSAVPFRRGTPTTGTVLVQLGPGGEVQVQAPAGAPTVRLEVLAWVPVTAAVVAPAVPVAPVSTTVGQSAATLQLGGRAGVPSSVTGLWVEVTATTPAPTTLALWTPGTAQPATGLPVSGTVTTLTVVRPDAAGQVLARLAQGSGSVSARVVGWSLGSSTLATPPAPTALATLGGSGVQSVRVAGTAGVPAAPSVVLLRAVGRDGARLDVWRGATSGSPTQSVRLSAAGTLLPLAPSTTLSLSFRVVAAAGDTTPGALTAQLSATGWSKDAAQQRVSWSPKAGTVVAGPSDVVSIARDDSGATAVLEATSPRPTSGAAVVLRPRDGGSPVMGRVSSVTARGDGRLSVRLSSEELALPDAFADLTAAYTGPLSAVGADGTPIAPSLVAGPAALPALPGVSVPAFGTDHLRCSVGIEPSDVVSMRLSYDGSANFSVSLRDRSVDLSVRGGVHVEVTLRNATYVSCSLEDTPSIFVPLGALPVALQLGGAGSLSLAPETEGQASGVTLGLTQRVYAAFSYSGGKATSAHSATTTGTVTPQDQRPTATLDLGLEVAVVPVSVRLVRGLSASASITAGLSLKIGPPTGERSQFYFGPRCVTASVGGYVEVGVDVAVRVLPDISVDVARWDSPRKTIYKGSCYGYTGTVTHRITGTNDSSCDQSRYCTRDTHSSTITRTLTPGPAQWAAGGGSLVQPSTWTGHMHNVAVDTWNDGSRDRTGRQIFDATGSGTWGWDDPSGYAPWVLDDSRSSTYPNSVLVSANYPSNQVTGTVTRSGYEPFSPSDPYPNGTYDWPTTIGWPGLLFDLPAGTPLLRDLPTVRATGSDYWTEPGGVMQTITIDLQRHEYPLP